MCILADTTQLSNNASRYRYLTYFITHSYEKRFINCEKVNKIANEGRQVKCRPSNVSYMYSTPIKLDLIAITSEEEKLYRSQYTHKD